MNASSRPSPRLFDATRMGRRSALLGAGLLALARPGTSRAATAAPWLATPAQIEAEQNLLTLLQDPALKQVQAGIRAKLAATPRGQTPEGAARLDGAIAQWTNSLIFAELMTYRPHPAFLWATDDTPRTWLGHTIGGVGTSGDNPDNIYRGAVIDGTGKYEILGKFDLSRRPSQFVLEADAANMANPGSMFTKPKKGNADVMSADVTTDRQLSIASDGSFRVLVNGPGPAGPHNFITPHGRITLGVRDVLGNWSDRPAQLQIRRLDSSAPAPYGLAEARAHLLADLPGYIGFWAQYPSIWMGGLKSNSIAPVRARFGGWGFLTGLRFQLAPGQALVVTTTHGAARYYGFQLTDTWMIAPDARRYQCSLNSSQVTPDADGATTYVISESDPGVANWLDPSGIQDGFGILRWQNVPPTMTAAGLVRDLRLLSLTDIVALRGVARVTPEQREQQIAARFPGYSARTT